MVPDYETIAYREDIERQRQMQLAEKQRIHMEETMRQIEENRLREESRTAELKAWATREIQRETEKKKYLLELRAHNAACYITEIKPTLIDQELKFRGELPTQWPIPWHENMIEEDLESKDPFPRYERRFHDESDFDSFLGASTHMDLNIVHGMPLLDHSIKTDMSDTSSSTSISARNLPPDHVRDCELLLCTMNALYEIWPQLKNNLKDLRTKRLRTYYTYILLNELNYLHDLDDAWATLLHIALLFDPGHNDNRIFQLGCLVRQIQSALPTTNLRYTKLSDTTIELVHILSDRMMKYRMAYNEMILSNKLQECKTITEAIIQNVYGAYFIANPTEQPVCFLRNLVYGVINQRGKRINLDEFYVEWLKMLTILPSSDQDMPKLAHKIEVMEFPKEVELCQAQDFVRRYNPVVYNIYVQKYGKYIHQPYHR